MSRDMDIFILHNQIESNVNFDIGNSNALNPEKNHKLPQTGEDNYSTVRAVVKVSARE